MQPGGGKPLFGIKMTPHLPGPLGLRGDNLLRGDLYGCKGGDCLVAENSQGMAHMGHTRAWQKAAFTMRQVGTYCT